MRQKFEMTQLNDDQRKLINEIMSGEKSRVYEEEENKEEVVLVSNSSEMPALNAKQKIDQLRRELLAQIKETALAAAKEHSMSMMRSDSGLKPQEAPLDFKKMMASMTGGR